MPVPRAPVISNFNPRSPHGERLEAAEPLVVNRHFNPRSPHGERHLVQWGNLRHVLISIHAPRTGSDGLFIRVGINRKISIHAPRTGSDATGQDTAALDTISIHAPRTGSDEKT